MTDGQWLYIMAMEKALRPTGTGNKYIVKKEVEG